MFRSIFKKAVTLLGIKKEEQCIEIYGLGKTVEIANKKFEWHPDAKLIKENISNPTNFCHMSAEMDDIIKGIINLDNKNNMLLKIYLPAD